MSLRKMREAQKLQGQQQPTELPQKPRSEDQELISRQMEEIKRLQEQLAQQSAAASQQAEQLRREMEQQAEKHRQQMQEQAEKNTQILSEKSELASLLQQQQQTIAQQAEQIVMLNESDLPQSSSDKPQNAADPSQEQAAENTKVADFAADLEAANEFMVDMTKKKYPLLKDEDINEVKQRALEEGGVFFFDWNSKDEVYDWGMVTLAQFQEGRLFDEVAEAMRELYKQLFLQFRKQPDWEKLDLPRKFQNEMDKLPLLFEKSYDAYRAYADVPKWKFREKKAAEARWDAIYKSVISVKKALKKMGYTGDDSSDEKYMDGAKAFLAELEDSADTERRATRPGIKSQADKAKLEAAEKRFKSLLAELDLITPEVKKEIYETLRKQLRNDPDCYGYGWVNARSKIYDILQKAQYGK